MTQTETQKKERRIRQLISFVLKGNDSSDKAFDMPTIRDLLGALASWGGKGKDEVVQALCREIGVATAAILKEPVNQVLEARKLQITLELIPKPAEKGRKKKKKKTTHKRQPA